MNWLLFVFLVSLIVSLFILYVNKCDEAMSYLGEKIELERRNLDLVRRLKDYQETNEVNKYSKK